MSDKKNRIIIHIIIYCHSDIGQKIFLKNFFKEDKKISHKSETVFETVFNGEINLDSKNILKYYLYVTDSDSRLRSLAKNSAGLILFFDPDEEKSFELFGNVFNNISEKNKTFDNLYITILANQFKETDIYQKAKKLAEEKKINFCVLEENEINFIEGIIKKIYNFNQNKKQEINQKEDTSKGNAKKSRECCGCFN